MKNILKWDQIPDEFKTILLDSARQVESLLCNSYANKYFIKAIERFMGLLKTHYVDISSNQNPDPMQWFLSPQTNLGEALIAANRIDGDILELQQRAPMPEEILMLHYVKLMAIHDILAKTLNISEQYFTTDDISNETDVGIVAQDIWERIIDEKARDIEKMRINVAIIAIQNDLAKLKPNVRKIITSLFVSIVVILLFELFVYYGPSTWLKNHPNSYGLQGGIIFLIPSVFVGLFVPQWRKGCWGVAALSFIVLILSLLGGVSKTHE